MTIDDLLRQRAIARSRLRAIIIRQRLADEQEANAQPLRHLPTKGQMTNARKSSRAINRHAQRASMLNMPAPANHKPVPYLVGERDKRLFAAHAKRREADWVRG